MLAFVAFRLNCRRSVSGIVAFSFLGLMPVLGAAGTTNGSSLDSLYAGNLKLKASLKGVHPRLLINQTELALARASFIANRDALSAFLPSIDSPELSAVVPTHFDKDASQWSTDLVILAAAYAATDDSSYLKALEARLPALKSFVPATFGHTSPRNSDLFVGFTLRNIALTYDLLYGRSPDVTLAVRSLLVAQARQTYADLKTFRTFSYEQGHLTTPVAGLLMAALVLADELPEAEQWGVIATNILRRSFSILAPDGWFFEGISYWKYNLQCQMYAAVALQAATGENLFSFPAPKNFTCYVAHTFLPNPRFAFDFSDWGPRVNPDGRTAQAGYDVPWHTVPTSLSPIFPTLLNRVQPDPLAQHLINWLGPLSSKFPFDSVWLTLWQVAIPQRFSSLPSRIAPYHFFFDSGVLHWRSSWCDAQATALAFKAGPPAGHRVASLLSSMPEWRPNLGHAHPDAGTFALFAYGVFLVNGDLGYTRKVTANTSSLLVDGKGQANEGTAFNAFGGLRYDDLDRIRMTNVWLGQHVAAATAVIDAAYPRELRLIELKRDLVLVDGRFLVLRDVLASNKPHTYEFRLQSDVNPKAMRGGGYMMENGPGRLALICLSPAVSFRAEPSIVETELYSNDRSRPQQRGFHLSIISPRQGQFQFLTAMAVESSQSVSAFSAQVSDEGGVNLRLP
jgi:hypothetical protein